MFQLLTDIIYIKDGYELISEALNLLNNVYGAMHPEIAQVKNHFFATFMRKNFWFSVQL